MSSALRVTTHLGIGQSRQTLLNTVARLFFFFPFFTRFEVKVQAPQGSGDDTAMNAIKLHCSQPGSSDLAMCQPMSAVGPYGTWRQVGQHRGKSVKLT